MILPTPSSSSPYTLQASPTCSLHSSLHSFESTRLILSKVSPLNFHWTLIFGYHASHLVGVGAEEELGVHAVDCRGNAAVRHVWVGDGAGGGVIEVLPGGRVRAAAIAHRGAGERAGEPGGTIADHTAVVVGHALTLCVIPALLHAGVAGVADGQGAAAAAVRPWGQDSASCKVGG